MLILSLFLLNTAINCQGFSPSKNLQLVDYKNIATGAMQTNIYLPLLKDKTIAVVTNQTGMIGKRHLIDSLLLHGVNIQRIFTPEHGFRGDHDAGATVASGRDAQTGIEVVSLYGRKKMPDSKDLQGIDLILFDLQDVGVRFYTYISTLTYVMEAAARHSIPVIVLDRPNPNGFYIDGPVLEAAHKSFVGLHPVPVVYGLTIGEYGNMVNGEGWLEEGLRCNLRVIPLRGYERQMLVKLPVRPSPNLPNWESVYLYPSLCFFEGTILSVGRGTDAPFQQFGHPDISSGPHTFTPEPRPGAASKPLLEGQLCRGFLLKDFAHNYAANPARLELGWLINAYSELKNKHKVFNNYFNTLAGNSSLKKQIEEGVSEAVIRKSWEDGLNRYKKIRAKYLLYPDF